MEARCLNCEALKAQVQALEQLCRDYSAEALLENTAISVIEDRLGIVLEPTEYGGHIERIGRIGAKAVELEQRLRAGAEARLLLGDRAETLETRNAALEREVAELKKKV